MDARGKRAYIGKYHLGKAVMEDTVLPIDELANVLTEDDLKKALDDIQKATDKTIKEIDEIVALKDKEILEV